MATKYKQGKDGYWTTKVWDGTYKDGKKHRVRIRSDKSSKDLERKVEAFNRAIAEKEQLLVSSMDLPDYARRWKNLYKFNTRLNTQSMYENVIEQQLIKLEGLSVSALTQAHLLLLLNSTTPSIGRQVYMTLKQIVKVAIRERYLPIDALDYIFEGVPCPKAKSAPKRALTPIEKDAVFNTTLEGMEKAYLWIAYGCGLRREEILALTKEDITDVITINKVVVFDVNRPVLEHETKSINGVRQVPMPAFVKEYLIEYCKTVDKFLFFKTHELLSKTEYRNMWKRIVRSLDEYVGQETNLTSHIFRHNFVSELCYQIPLVSIKTIAALAGDSEKVVMDIYNHIILEKEDKQLAIENALGKI